MRGRKPKPTGLKLLTGNPGKRPLNEREPIATPGLPRCPAHLNEEAKGIWRELASDVFWFARVDRYVVESLCVAVATKREALAAIAKTGKVLRAKARDGIDGGFYQNPWVPIYNKAVEQEIKLSSLLGLNPADRGRLQVDAGNADDDELAAFIKSGASRHEPRGRHL